MTTSKLFAALALTCFLPLPAMAQERQAGPQAIMTLNLELDGHSFRVQGNPFDRVAIMLGIERASAALPGNALLGVMPIFVTNPGEFDAQGSYELDIEEWLNDVREPFTVYVQAIAIEGDSNFFATSNVLLFGILQKTDPGKGDVGTKDTDDGRVDTQPLDGDGRVDTQPLDGDGRVDTQPLDGDGRVDTQPLDGDGQVDTQPLDNGQVGTQPLDNGQTGTQPLGDDPRSAKIMPVDGDAKRADPADLEPGVTGTH